ncbi:NADPH-dependent ferric siderophore reductase, contains FAD-binding and SIP domains [Mesorhizobium albiziae]|uniref:NADPH-dependent ferric siderophore reductase, contains FAD-binding and SIP domains n=1 Tax=Neomesorhizobium albiziae TaxID=335020 RepID=A0A1I4DN95_9HYPH|nr:siderophore-interacting protein [Mesorhizobium albiziae]GLS31269.1 NADPH-dependent ferric siderophore reductase [Mesorhizobium albiziae]SFK94553.1 NADPH-dependent ferric siderophore reductase, contains FAD-binding and SIP domains [Mesorhizobium albiziae]
MAEMPRFLRASTEIALVSPEDVMKRLCAHFAEHGSAQVEGRCARIDTGFGVTDLEACERCLKVFAEGKDDTSLAYVKLAIAEHILRLAAAEHPRIIWRGDGAAGSALPYFREMRVARVADIGPHMRRLTLSGDDLGRFASGGLHVRLLIPRDPDAKPVWPVTGEDGRPSWPSDDARPDVRIYTIRRIDVERGEVDIDFVMHGGSDMPGACFADRARPGDCVGMTGPGGGSIGDADWYLLAGDETALPAIARILEELPAGKQATVRVEVADARDEQPLLSSATLDVKWLHRGAAEPGTSRLLENAVRAIDWPDSQVRIFAWAGCEYRSFRAIRTYLRRERDLSRDEHLVVAYWRRGSSGDDARKENGD